MDGLHGGAAPSGAKSELVPLAPEPIMASVIDAGAPTKALALAAATWLTACGGGNPDLPAGFSDPGAAPRRSDLLPIAQPRRGQRQAAVTAQRLPTPSEVFDFVEHQFPQFFPSNETNQLSGDLVYRFYPRSGNYVGVFGDSVLVLGPLSNHVGTRVGSLQDFAAAVFASRPVPAPGSDADAARFLLHAQFSASTQEIAAVRAQGYANWLDAQLVLPASQSGWDWLVEKGYATVDTNEFFFAFGSNNFMIWYQLFQSPDTVRRRWALALSEIFVVSWRGIKDVMNWDNFAMAEYWDLLCRHGLGNYRELLEALTLNPAMGAFLSTRGNEREDAASGRVPDENYAREVMQLFSIGLHDLNLDGSVKRDGNGQPVESYAANDVSNLARVFTGYNFDRTHPTFVNPKPPHQTINNVATARGRMVLDASKHSTMEKSFLGVTIPANTPAAESLRIALDTLANHPNTAPFLARQFIQRMVTSNPNPAYVARVARTFLNNGAGVRGDLKAVLRAVLLDPEARGAASLASATFGKLREPMHRIAQWGRTFKLHSKRGTWKANFGPWDPVRDLGQFPLDPPSVFSYFRPGYVPPGTQLAQTGATAPEFQIVNESTVATWINQIMSVVYQGIWVSAPERAANSPVPTATDGPDIAPDYSIEKALVADSSALVRRLNLLLCAGQLSPATSQLIADALRLDGIRSDSTDDFKQIHVARAIMFVMCCAEYLVQR